MARATPTAAAMPRVVALSTPSALSQAMITATGLFIVTAVCRLCITATVSVAITAQALTMAITATSAGIVATMVVDTPHTDMAADMEVGTVVGMAATTVSKPASAALVFAANRYSQ